MDYQRVDFAKQPSQAVFRIKSPGCVLSVVCGHREIVRADIPSTANDWDIIRLPLKNINMCGVQNLRVEVLSGEVAIDWMSFK